MSNLDSERRPLKTRSAAWAQRLAALLARRRVSPNAISVTGLGFALVGGALLLAVSRSAHSRVARPARGRGLYSTAAALQHARWLGRGGRARAFKGRRALQRTARSRGGHGVARHRRVMPRDAVELGWFAAALALLTAYLRAFGGSLGQPADFRGPGAKPQRMFWLSVGCLCRVPLFPRARLGARLDLRAHVRHGSSARSADLSHPGLTRERRFTTAGAAHGWYGTVPCASTFHPHFAM